VIDHETLGHKLVRAVFAIVVTAAVVVAAYYTIAYLAGKHLP
jgi:hypothetical protein